MATYSAINDNIERLEFLFSQYLALHDVRPDAYKTGVIPKTFGEINFSIADYQHSKQERILLELLIVWAVISLESMANHVIAEQVTNDICSIFMIENPKKMTEMSRNGRQFSSDLQHKLLIIGDDSDEALKIAHSLSRIIVLRNSIVHDKPYRFNQIDDDVEVTKLSKWKEERSLITHADSFELLSTIDSAFDYLRSRIDCFDISNFRFIAV